MEPAKYFHAAMSANNAELEKLYTLQEKSRFSSIIADLEKRIKKLDPTFISDSHLHAETPNTEISRFVGIMRNLEARIKKLDKTYVQDPLTIKAYKTMRMYFNSSK